MTTAIVNSYVMEISAPELVANNTNSTGKSIMKLYPCNDIFDHQLPNSKPNSNLMKSIKYSEQYFDNIFYHIE